MPGVRRVPQCCDVQEAQVVSYFRLAQLLAVATQHDDDAQRQTNRVHSQHDDAEGGVAAPLGVEALELHVAGQVPLALHIRAPEHAAQLDAYPCVYHTC